MKTFSFTNKKGNNTSTYNSYEFINPLYTSKKNTTNYVDNLLKDAYKKLLPWTKKDPTTEIYIIEVPEKKHIAPEFIYTSISPTALNLEWNKAASALLEYAYYLDNPTYDFILNGEAIKVHGNYIQIGSKIIPTFTNSKYFNSYSTEDKINLYNIAVNINMTIAA